jgi:hypothetical protein
MPTMGAETTAGAGLEKLFAHLVDFLKRERTGASENGGRLLWTQGQQQLLDFAAENVDHKKLEVP